MKGQEWYQENDVAKAYDDKRFSGGGRFIDRREKAAVLDALAPVEDKRILEVACGTGRFTVMLADRGANIVGMDISEAMLEQGRRKARAAGVAETLSFMQADAGRLPFPDDHFDTVFAMRFFHLAPDPGGFIEEMCRVSKSQVFFDTFNRYSTRSIYNWALPMGSRLYSGREARELIVGSGLELADLAHDFVLPYGFYRAIPDWIARPFRAADRALGRTPIGDHLASVSYWDTRIRE
ncbi:MAG: methyltransferase domain-containing protein [Natronomonas sp.]|uniref:class I SAM-dependent methyltransferase n=1 Tax=Natronomonas sp. TaxID=2184060 RepID=UPI00286FC8FC|nr:methyltransferase domain-containing protein [Natronomonas sp.]MDR9382536.1 methyltransferase domain-containing protein [Natronomonas sp.]MDR9429737.1 methyltransferase domain-containing protein [Natronomonas sp.]